MEKSSTPNPPRRVTLDDLAQAAGISRSAASKAMRNHREVSKATQKKVQKLAEEMGYVRDPALSRLAKYRWDSQSTSGGDPIAFIYPFDGEHAYDTTFHEVFEKVATREGFSLQTFYAADYKPERLRKILFSRGIRGVVFQRIVDLGYIEALIHSHFTCVSIGEGRILPPCEMIRADYLWCLSDAIRRHREAGKTQPALILRFGMKDNRLSRQLEAIWRNEGFSKKSIVYYKSTHPAPLERQLKKLQPDSLISFIWTEIPTSICDPAGKPLPQISLRLFDYFLKKGNGYYLSEERIAKRALHHLDSHLIQTQGENLYGMTLLRPEWVDAH